MIYQRYDELEVNIELIPLRNDKTESGVEHYPMHPYVEYDENCKIGLVHRHSLLMVLQTEHLIH